MGFCASLCEVVAASCILEAVEGVEVVFHKMLECMPVSVGTVITPWALAAAPSAVTEAGFRSSSLTYLSLTDRFHL